MYGLKMLLLEAGPKNRKSQEHVIYACEIILLPVYRPGQGLSVPGV